MPPDGRIVACDNSAEWTDVAKRFWKKAGLADRIELRLGSAVDTFEDLIKERQEFDFVFIDANKEDYDSYYEFVFEAGAAERSHRHRQHVARRSGRRSQRDQLSITAVRDLSAKIAKDERGDRVLLTVGDGMMLVRRR